MPKRCGSKHRYVMRIGSPASYTEQGLNSLPEAGDVSYEEVESRCTKSLGHPGKHLCWVRDEDFIMWDDPYEWRHGRTT